jgi:hypothetical protein
MSSLLKKYCLTLSALIFLGLNASFAQDYTPSLMYERESSTGILFHTRGIGLSYERTHHKTADNYRLFDFSLSTLKNPKEFKQSNPDKANSRPYVFGKINSLITLDASYGARRILADKLTRESIRINWNYSIGPCLGILKPMYYDLDIQKPDGSGSIRESKPFDQNDPNFASQILGNSPFMTGIKKTSFMPGLVGKTGFSFEWGNYEDRFYSVETGIMINAFPSDVPIFAFDQNQKIFANLFLTLAYGTRK